MVQCWLGCDMVCSETQGTATWDGNPFQHFLSLGNASPTAQDHYCHCARE